MLLPTDMVAPKARNLLVGSLAFVLLRADTCTVSVPPEAVGLTNEQVIEQPQVSAQNELPSEVHSVPEQQAPTQQQAQPQQVQQQQAQQPREPIRETPSLPVQPYPVPPPVAGRQPYETQPTKPTTEFTVRLPGAQITYGPPPADDPNRTWNSDDPSVKGEISGHGDTGPVTGRGGSGEITGRGTSGEITGRGDAAR